MNHRAKPPTGIHRVRVAAFRECPGYLVLRLELTTGRRKGCTVCWHRVAFEPAPAGTRYTEHAFAVLRAFTAKEPPARLDLASFLYAVHDFCPQPTAQARLEEYPAPHQQNLPKTFLRVAEWIPKRPGRPGHKILGIAGGPLSETRCASPGRPFPTKGVKQCL